MKISAYIAASLDGYIAREDGALDWLSAPLDEPGGEDYGFWQFFDSVDLFVMGRKSFEKVLTLGPWIYGEKPVFVLSSRPVAIPATLQSTVEWRSSSPIELKCEFDQMNLRGVYVDGGKTIQSFLADGLLDELTVTWIPILIGRGIPLFGRLEKDARLKLVENRAFDNGFVQSRYEILPLKS